MALTDAELSVVNLALLLTGSKKIDIAAPADTKSLRLATDSYGQARDEMFELPYNWKFAIAREELSLIYKLTIDSAPAPAVWSAGKTLTGASSGATCTVIAKTSNTEYIVSDVNGDFTDGEVISDSTNSRDCAAGYPEIEEIVPISGYGHQYKLPDNCMRVIAQIDEGNDEIEYKHRIESYIDAANNEIDVLLTDQSDCFVKYIALRTDPTKWPGWFKRLVYTNLALLLCEPLKQDKLKKNQILVMFEESLKKAIDQNGLSDSNVSGKNVNLDKGNNDILDAAGTAETKDKYIELRTE